MTEQFGLARIAEDADLSLLQGIESAATELFSSLMDIGAWSVPPTGDDRVDSGGNVLVVGTPAVGFAHVTEIDGKFRLDQVAVHPDHARQGLGTELVYAAAELVAARGGDSLSLVTFADVPWNAPFFEALGFVPVDPVPAELAELMARESAHPRVALARPISPGVVPRPAVSVIPVRDGDKGLEVFVQHRVQTMDFAPGVVVFPGGRIDPVDSDNPPEIPAHELEELCEVWKDSTYVSQADDPRFAVRVVLATGIREVAEETGVRLAPDELLPWDDWTTPPGLPKRFQVHFMVTHLPKEDPRSPHNTTTEARASEWLEVTEILRRGAGGDLQVMTPTRVILEELAAFGDAQAVLSAYPEVTPVHFDRRGQRPRASRPRPSRRTSSEPASH